MTEAPFLSDTRAAYDILAATCADLWRHELDARPVDRSMLTAFAELVLAADLGPVADIGCGPGRVTGHLRSLGLVNAFGIDLSPAMIEIARHDHPELRFEVGSMLDLEIADGALGGVLGWYSLIHIVPELVPTALAEFERVLAPGGYLLLGFQVGADVSVRTEAFGHEFPPLHFHRLLPDRLAEQLGDAGFVVSARLQRERIGEDKTEQAFILARKPTAPEPELADEAEQAR
ncbi:SAM-dependent methyltransferase [Allocatelliglobosispora scoriae]|uniref:SAM-dependent methyltransferase n=1 Tax=Allocatelliglobosispora scoriae TaxID=643052 RepID=A0A841BJK9_9ACTN|nr:class I SAM-dependent methyltransferase [Allocatelliglobosispora scoriae]MBB5868444.1 SAM-dependent methyltransferase [Allocatelliglobosispora scoriae]